MASRLAVLALLLVALLALAASSARAQSDDELRKSRAHFVAGSALYNAHSYEDAVREFWAGYRLMPLPEFLLNLGQAYRKLDDLPHARAMYARFLKEAPPDASERAQVQKLLEKIDGEISARAAPPPEVIAAATPRGQPAPSPSPPEAAPSPSPEVVVAAPPSPPVVTAPVASLFVVEKPAPRRSFWRRNWWIAPVAGVAVAAVVVGLAVGLTASPSSVGCHDSGVIGCLTVPSK